MQYHAKCPECGRFTTVAFNKKDIRRNMRIPCEQCRAGVDANKWKEVAQN